MGATAVNYQFFNRVQVQLSNAIIGVRRVLPLGPDAGAEIRLGGRPWKQSFGWTIGCTSRRGTYNFKVDRLPELGIFSSKFEGVFLDEVGSEFQLLALNTAVGHWLDSVRLPIGSDWQFTSIFQDDEEPDQSKLPFCIEIAPSGSPPIRGQVWLDQKQAQGLPDFLAQLRYETHDLPGELPVAVQFVIANVELYKEEFDQIESGDLLLLPHDHSKVCGRCSIFSGERFLCAAGLTANDARVHAMPNLPTQPRDEADKGSNPRLNQITVNLRFQLGEQTLTLAELERLRAGYIFQLARGVDEPVEIRCNGMLIGEGQLLNVEGRAGIMVLRWFAATESEMSESRPPSSLPLVSDESSTEPEPGSGTFESEDPWTERTQESPSIK